MRSVVVVFPASMCAEIPMFRYRSMGVARATVNTPLVEGLSGRIPRQPGGLQGGYPPFTTLPAVVCEGLVGLGHAVRIFALTDSGAATLSGIHQLVGETERHGLLAAVTSSLDDPTHGQCLATSRPNFNGDLVGRTADAAGLHLDDRLHVVQGSGQHFDGFRALLAGLLADAVEGTVNDALGSGLLAALHDDVH